MSIFRYTSSPQWVRVAGNLHRLYHIVTMTMTGKGHDEKSYQYGATLVSIQMYQSVIFNCIDTIEAGLTLW